MDWYFFASSALIAAVVSGLVAVFLNIANSQSLLSMMRIYDEAIKSDSKLRGEKGEYLDKDTLDSLLLAIRKQADRKAKSFSVTEMRRRVPIICLICGMIGLVVGYLFTKAFIA